MPTFAWWPGQIDAGSRSDRLAVTMDVFPTVAALTGAEPPDDWTGDGESLVPTLLDGDRKLDIEVDGERYHRDWNGELQRRDQLRSQRLIERGWDVMRFWVYQVRDDLDRCVERAKGWEKTS